MKIPQGDKRRDRFKRFDFFQQLIERCRVSRVERREQYTSRRFHWLYGTDGSYENTDTDIGLGPPPGNKIYPHLDYVTSFLYAAETTRFACQVGAEVAKPFMQMVPKVNERINEVWHASNTDIIVGNAITLALVFDSMFIKPMWRGNNVYPGVVYPHNFGVLREDITMLSRQEAFAHWFPMTVGQFRTDYAAHLPRLNSVLDKVNKRASGMIEAAETGLNRIIMSAQSPLGGSGPPQGSGVVDWLNQVGRNYVPRVKEELIDMVELFIWDDALNDYRLVTLADPDIVIFDRPASQAGWIEQECPFVQICPNPDPGYFWGISECERLQPLQAYRNRCLAQIDHLQDLQAHPPSTSSGFPGDLAEIHYVLDTPNGMLNQPDPAGISGGPKADRVKIEVPNDLYERLARIDDMFDEMSGLPPIARGQNPPGVRGGGHAMDLAKLGTARIKRRAMVIEDALEQLATVYVRLMAKYDPTQLEAPVEAGKQDQVEQFILKQFPDSFTVKVDGHSNSPIFVDDQTALAFQLLKAKAIDRETLLDMVPIPSRQLLVHKLRDVIEPSEAAAQKAEQDFELKKAQAAGNRGRPRKPGNGAAAPE